MATYIIRSVQTSSGLPLPSGDATSVLNGGTEYVYAGITFNATVNVSGYEIISVAAAPCYCAGTLILTEEGERPVENLAIGDRVVTRTGKARPIKWIGRRSFAPRFIGGNRALLPILVRAGALADGVPARDLWVSPGHALYFDDRLVKAEALVNGVSIVQGETIDNTIEYFHIELDSHDILLAEGAPAESYIDCDNRGQFHNAAEFARLYPKAARPPGAYSCPHLDEGEALYTLRRRLLARLDRFGWELSPDPDLHLLVDGRPLYPEGETHSFRLAGRPREIRIRSRSAVPRAVGINHDTRRLGIKLRRITLKSASLTLTAAFDEPLLAEGFHEAEDAHRWTDGDASLPNRLFDCFTASFAIEIEAEGLAHYPVPLAQEAARVAQEDPGCRRAAEARPRPFSDRRHAPRRGSRPASRAGSGR
ncbi:MAG TPA: Hint domain-containing protein [Stellaceae bacterium]|nr:Hint domain-containing protein [Stellaceae bacterium]